jgi:hypothetical protein
MLPALDDLSTLDFTLISTCSLATERIVVDLRSRPFLANKSITQILQRSNRHEPWFITGNLTEEVVREAATSDAGFSQIWDNHTYPTFGDPASAKPNPAYSNTGMPIVPPVQKFVTALKAHDIGKWSDNIAEGVDPDAIAVEPPIETEDSPVRPRLVRGDSDDEEEKPDASSPPATQRLILVDSDDEDEENLISDPVSDTNSRGKAGDDALLTAENLRTNEVRGGLSDPSDRSVDDKELSSSMPSACQPEAALQPTWTSNSFSDPSRGRGQGESALSEHESTILARSTNSLQSASTRQPSHSVTTQASIAQTREETGLGKMIGLRSELRKSNQNQSGRTPLGGNSVRGLHSAPRLTTPATRGGRGQASSFTGTPSRYGGEASGINTQLNYSHPVLVPVYVESPGTAPQNIRPPPGLEIRNNTIQHLSRSTSIGLLDGPLDDIQHPSIQPSPIHSENSRDPLSAGTKRSSNLSSGNSGASYVNTFNPPPDRAKIENERLAELFKDQEETREKKRLEKEAEKLRNETKPQTRTASSRNKSQKKQSADEVSSRQYHGTMRQQAPKPGKKGKQAAKKLTDKERKQKIDNLLGNSSTSGASTKPMPPTASEVEVMSSRKKQALKNNPDVDPVAAAHLTASQLTSKQTLNLIQYLNPLFAASQAFPGQLKFEIQLGQVLIAKTKNLVAEDIQLFSIKNWESAFSPPAGTQQPVATTFTNILTRNGHDIDRLLQMKSARGPGGRVPEKLFDQLKPGPSEISYEFQCQSKESEEFWVIIDSTGQYSIRKSTSTIGTVNLHYPANIWDARAILHGTAEFCEPEEETALIVASFMDSVYVPAQDSLCITYRQPAENDMTVRSVTAKRTSLHNCQTMEGHDFQLQVVEVKDLFHRFHNKDKKLTQAFEKGYPEMLEQDRIHYEVSIVHKHINNLLKQNQSLQTGDLTTGFSTGKNLLKPRFISQMLDLVNHIVSKIDWAGVHNNGTLVRTTQEEHDLAARVATTVPGTRRPAPSFAGMTSTAGPGTAMRTDVHGIRINTMAEMGYDADGKPVLIGMGGAMIPITAEGDDLQIPASELAPNDSASNVGVNPAFVQQGYVPSAAFARGVEARGPTFW